MRVVDQTCDLQHGEYLRQMNSLLLLESENSEEAALPPERARLFSTWMLTGLTLRHPLPLTPASYWLRRLLPKHNTFFSRMF